MSIYFKLYPSINLINNFKNLNVQARLLAVLLFSIAISSHGLLHGHIEVHNGWNPLAGNFDY